MRATKRSIAKYEIKSIQTEYNGIVYRSRTEARWALFFDALGIPHEYEPDGFVLSDAESEELYVPDFWLPHQNCWAEIKGEEPEEDACEKCHRLATASGKDVFAFYGGHTLPGSAEGVATAYAFFPDGGGDTDYAWCQCPTCKRLGITFEGRSDRLPCKECSLCHYYQEHPFLAEQHRAECKKVGGCPRSSHGDKGRTPDAQDIIEAIKIVRAKRWFRE